jgi:hypothetical protein
MSLVFAISITTSRITTSISTLRPFSRSGSASFRRNYASMSTSNKPGPSESVFVQLHINDLRTTDSPALSLAHSQGKKHITYFLPIYVFDERILPLDCIPGFSASRQTRDVQGKTSSGEAEKEREEDAEEEEIKPLGQEDKPSRTTTNQPATKDRDHRSTGRVGPRSRLGNFWRVGRHRAKFLVETVFDLKKTYESKGGGLIIACGKPEDVAVKVVESLVKSGKKVEGVWTQKEVRFVLVSPFRDCPDGDFYSCHCRLQRRKSRYCVT